MDRRRGLAVDQAKAINNIMARIVVTVMAAVLVIAMPMMIIGARAYSDNCSGSGLCGQVSKSDCLAAIARYDDGTVYSQYTSRVTGHCTAIYRCDGNYEARSGADLKQQFMHIYNAQPCGRCGSHAFDNCEATLNYCGNCRDDN